MVGTLHNGPDPIEAPTLPEPEAQDRPFADIAAQIRQSEAGSQAEPSYFFRGFVIFMAIAAVFWIAVIGLFHLI
jgi:hypothetical protein